jgi:purine-binding chemotaxis protein CheW
MTTNDVLDLPTTSLRDAAAAARVCVVAVGGELFALHVQSVREVVPFEDLTPVPLAPPYVVGVANLRGEVVAIVDARSTLRLPAGRPGRRHRAIVVAAAGLEAALVIDDVVSLEALGAIVPATPEAGLRHAEWATGYLRRDNRLVPLLDVGKLLNALRPVGSSVASVGGEHGSRPGTKDPRAF